MVIENFTIKLDNPEITFTPGRTISGQVVLSSNGDDCTKVVQINFSATAHVQKTQRGGTRYYSNGRSYPVSYTISATRNFINESKILLGDGTTEISIPGGTNRFPFSFELPPTSLPHSCRIGYDSYVTYVLQARIRKPWYRPDIRSDPVNLKVVTPFHLNKAQSANVESKVMKEHRFRWFWHLSEPLSLTAVINPSGYCLGQIIPVTVQINNKSDKNFTDVIAELIREWGLQTRDSGWRDTWKITDPISKINRNEGVSVNCNVEWKAGVPIPKNELPTMHESASDIIKMGYFIRITACVDSLCSCNAILELPVIIGNTPF